MKVTDRMRVELAASRFPATFGLRGWPGKVFRLSLQASYVSEGNVVLYTQILLTPEQKNGQGITAAGDAWCDFAKGSPDELMREVTQ